MLAALYSLFEYFVLFSVQIRDSTAVFMQMHRCIRGKGYIRKETSVI